MIQLDRYCLEICLEILQKYSDGQIRISNLIYLYHKNQIYRLYGIFKKTLYNYHILEIETTTIL